MGILLSYSLRSLWVRRGTTLATAGGIALVVFVLASSLMLVSGVKRTLALSGSPAKVIVMQESAYAEIASRLSQSVLGIVAAAPGVAKSEAGAVLASGEAVEQLTVARSDDPSRIVSVQIRGVSENVAEVRPEVHIVAGRWAQPRTQEAIVGSALAGRYQDIRLGGELELRKGRKIQIVGIFEAGGASFESEIWTDLNAVQTSGESEGFVSSVTARLSSAADFEAFAASLLNDNRQEGLAVERESDYYERLSQGLSNMIIGLGGMVTALFSFGAILGAAITMYGAVAHRAKEIGVLKALGFSRGHVLLAFMVESCGLAIVGTAVGLALALVTTFAEFSTANLATGGVEVAFRFLLSPRILLAAALAGIILGTLGGLFPALKASRINPIDAVRV